MGPAPICLKFLRVNSLNIDQSKDTKFNPPLFSLINTFKCTVLNLPKYSELKSIKRSTSRRSSRRGTRKAPSGRVTFLRMGPGPTRHSVMRPSQSMLNRTPSWNRVNSRLKRGLAKWQCWEWARDPPTPMLSMGPGPTRPSLMRPRRSMHEWAPRCDQVFSFKETR